jgi:heme exporter protein B
MDPVIRLRSAVALVGRFPVLAGVDLDVGGSEIVLLQGANGAGKTSILRACAGLVRVVAGDATVLGCDLTVDPRPLRRRVGLLGHAGALYDDLGVEDNVRLAVRAAGAPVAAVAPALERLGLTGRLRAASVGSLSAGQRRRVALAVLVARAPELWLLDEPHAGLDAEHRDLLDTIVRDAVDGGATVVLASHEHDRAYALAGRVVTVAGGAVTADEPLTPLLPLLSARPTASVLAAVPGAPAVSVLAAAPGAPPVSVLAAAPGAPPAARPVSEASPARRPTGPAPFPPAGFPADPSPASAPPAGPSLWRDARLVAGKDLRIERRSRVTTNQVGPYAVLVLLLFGIAFDQDRPTLLKTAPGLFWIAVLLCALLAVQRSFAVEAGDGARDGLRMSGMDAGGIFLGKAAAIAVQLVGLEILLGVGTVVLFGTALHGGLLLVTTAVLATAGLAAAGTVYGVMAAGLRVRETLLPLLILPIVAPVLLAATQAWLSALRISSDDGWRWLGLLGAFAALYLTLGVLGFGTLLEEV